MKYGNNCSMKHGVNDIVSSCHFIAFSATKPAFIHSRSLSLSPSLCLKFSKPFTRKTILAPLTGTGKPLYSPDRYSLHSGDTLSDRVKMSAGELLSIEPQELQFPFELKKQISCSLQLANKTDNYVAFKVKTTNPKKYCVRPNTGIVMPHSACDVIVTMQAQKEAPPDMQCKDKFLLQSVVASPGATGKDITPEMFNKESGNHVEECKLRVAYVPPPQPPSPVREESEEGSSPRASISENGNGNTADYTPASRAFAETEHVEPQDNSSEVKALISKLAEEKKSAILQNSKLHQELELLRRESKKSRGGMPLVYVAVIGVLGILLGYLIKTT
ncbi:vesicle-associated protein 1-2-like [Diospyros lotus]|uniref:vesicle-associated protein 1-2-like n=1 Tax=Diospyros lotus TaxID=55363 RepID=UPI00224DA74C|nr:vesicle-associated protein 1-2-like [Diospyros lotus]